ncbi:hypothetical protein [Saccharospirillum salsuginis]|uniref:Nucleotidyltransferase domain-containing protein n=1 Tax=Saccharospirillum salsuginis TaxID=418750 RepID=A0A918KD10_9GAMM|nr:hypothetical protein [Saccharospirillum salsuginis]GGX57648.1 hypothetical protein GCM10007392_26560 [Saccharospirillum salsuginis]
MNEPIGGISQVELLGLIESQITESTPVWIAGSLVENIGNESSDIDIYAVVDDLDTVEEYVTDGGSYKIQMHYYKNRRVDVEFWSQDSVSSLASKLSELKIERAESSFLDALSENEIDFLHRVFNCIVAQGVSTFNDLVGQFDSSKLNQYLFENKRIYIDDSFDDTVGMLNSNNITGAISRSIETLEFSLDLLLYSKGWTNPKSKHRFKIIESVYESDLDVREAYLDFWSVLHNLPVTKGEKKNHVSTVLSISEDIVEKAYRTGGLE